MTAKSKLQTWADWLRKRMKAVERGGPAWKAYRECLEDVKREMAAKRARLVVESPDEE
jgi:hypothetical protein